MTWYHQSNLTVDRDVIRAMAAAGCTKIGFGVEGKYLFTDTIVTAGGGRDAFSISAFTYM
jgi:hypothetical protein